MRGVIVSAFAQPDLHVGSRTPVHPEYVPDRTRDYPLMKTRNRFSSGVLVLQPTFAVASVPTFKLPSPLLRPAMSALVLAPAPHPY